MGRGICSAKTNPAGLLMLHAALQSVGIVLALFAVLMAFGPWPALFAVGLAVTIISAAVEAGER